MEKRIVIALAGNANVGKSVIFNYLTGLHQHIGNWPGKTVEKAEGTLHFKGYIVDIIDLPGIYSMSTYSIEESISREFIAVDKPDVVINVLDASALERNLFFTLQLMELNVPMIIALNQMDMARKKGIQIDVDKMEKILGVPVVETIAVKGVRIFRLLEKALEIADGKLEAKPSRVRYGEELEKRLERLAKAVEGIGIKYPSKYVAIKLLESDREIVEMVRKANPETVSLAEKVAKEVEEAYGHSCPTVITSERYRAVCRILEEVQRIVPPPKPTLGERLHNVTTNWATGYPIMVAMLIIMFVFTFTLGNILSDALSQLLYGFKPLFLSIFGVGPGEVLWGGVAEGLIAGITLAVSYIIPFYIALYLLEDSGYLSRIAFLMDGLMHKMGLHGKAFIPLMLGYGCNVPACLSCRIMETQRERFLAAFVVTLVPCTARSIIILGLVGRFLGIQWTFLIYVLDLLIVFSLGRLASRILPGEPTGLIMEMPDYRCPHLKTVLRQTWFRFLEYLKIALPLIVATTFFVKLTETLGLLEVINAVLSPITVWWLGLPEATGVTLIFGLLRKELTLIMLASILGTTDFRIVLTSFQMIVFTLVTMLYIPCVATIATLAKEFGWRRALIITVSEVLFAIIIGGAALRILVLTGLTT
ncbi:MAG: ferrous iron transport protein B [Thermoproteota archaeon]